MRQEIENLFSMDPEKLQAVKRELIREQERKEAQGKLIQSSRETCSTKLWASLDDFKEKIVGQTYTIQEMDDAIQSTGNYISTRLWQQSLLFMKAVHKMLMDVFEWHFADCADRTQMKKELEDFKKSLSELQVKQQDSVQVVRENTSQDVKKETSSRGKGHEKNSMDVKSLYCIVSNQMRIEEYVLKDSLVKLLDDEKKYDELGLIVQGKWNHVIVDAVSRIAKARIVLFNSRTKKYKDFGDRTLKDKVMIYARGSELALLKKGAKRIGTAGPGRPKKGQPVGQPYGYSGAVPWGFPLYAGGFPQRIHY